jgi:23S rRNA (adenine1618-N6)-methyltransferase
MTRPPRLPPAGPASRADEHRDAPRLHPRNRHQGQYDFRQLLSERPELAGHLIRTAHGTQSIDFGNPAAVRELNRALLQSQYGIEHWQLPDGYLCPPIPGRADYLHHLADLLAASNDGVVPRGPRVCGLDIGVGASCIYPLIGQREYGWRFVGTDIDETALASAATILRNNAGLAQAVELRHQPERGRILSGVLHENDVFDFSLCNPPFHASADEAARGTRRKWSNLGAQHRDAGDLNFGGKANELWCTGGEASFLRRMIREGVAAGNQVFWFSSLVSRAGNLPELQRQLRKLGARDVRLFAMAQGNKQSRFIAWTFLDEAERQNWKNTRWGSA